jgi:RNA-directed DNA polymerase
VKDKRVLRLIRRYLQAGMMEDGLVSPRTEGTPQGSPLSPLLSNILLDELDKELERRGHRFVRYADDCNVYVKSEAAGERVLGSLERFLAKRLRLKVNREKSAVGRPWERKFLGYTVSRQREPRLLISLVSVTRFREKLKRVFRKARGRNLGSTIRVLTPILRGWVGYFRLAESEKVLEDLDGWIRRRLRWLLWRQWKKPKTRLRKLREHGVPAHQAAKGAYNGRGPWWNSAASHMNRAIPNSMLSDLGLVSLLQERRRLTHAL